MEKKTYSKPVLMAERFEPQEYVASCFTYEAMLVCSYGAAFPAETGGPDELGCYEAIGYDWWGNPIKGAQHGEPCANSTIRVSVVNGVATYEGHEGGNKTDIQLQNVNIPGIENPHNVGDPLTDCEWTSNLGGTYHHKGSGTVTRWIKDDSVGSNHS